jgi:hypothetical protein
MFMNNFDAILAQKYAILGEHADAAVGQAIAANRNATAANTSADAGAQKTIAEAGQVGPNAQALRELQRATAGKETAEAGQVPANAAALRALQNATAGQTQATTYGIQHGNQPAGPEDFNFLHNELQQSVNPGGLEPSGAISGPSGGVTTYGDDTSGIHEAHGTSMVPGKPTPKGMIGKPQSDTVPAELAPGEAVLNKHAAEMIGRDKIAAANAMGQHMATVQQNEPPTGAPVAAKGMIPAGGKASPRAPVATGPKAQKFAGGTHMVGHGKSAKTPTKLNPADVMGLMQMLGHGQPAAGPAAGPMPSGAGSPAGPAMQPPGGMV